MKHQIVPEQIAFFLEVINKALEFAGDELCVTGLLAAATEPTGAGQKSKALRFFSEYGKRKWQVASTLNSKLIYLSPFCHELEEAVRIYNLF